MGTGAGQRRVCNLPAELTSFVGRRHEVAAAKALLSRNRLLTLVGAGGVGKTRLAVQVARQVRRAFADGVWLADLALLQDDDLELVAQTVLDNLNVRNDSVRPPAVALAEYLAGRSLLLVLDNCEHVLDGCARLVRDLLGAAPGLRILATSREALAVPGEQVLPIPPLPVPDPGSTTSVAESESLTLFAERAAAAVPGFTLDTERDLATAAQIVRGLDGIPLAIELAVLQLRALSLQQLLDRLSQPSERGRRAAPSRQRTLRSTIDWSFQHCRPEERTLWARLSVFPCSFDLESAEAICSGEGIGLEEVFDRLCGLVGKSIVTRDDRMRFRMLETIRRYGRERLARSGEEPALRRRHHDHFRLLAIRAMAEWYGPAQVEWCRRLRLDRANLRVALRYCLTEPGEARAGLETAALLRPYWLAGGSLSEGLHWLARLLELHTEPDLTRANALWTKSWLALWHHDVDRSVTSLEEARAIARHLPDRRLHAWIAQTAGMLMKNRGDLRAAAPLLKEALDAHRAAHDVPGTIMTLLYLGHSMLLLNEPERATRHCEDAIALCDERGESWNKARALWTLGLAAWREGDHRRAIDLERQAIRRLRAFDDRKGIADCVGALAWIYSDLPGQRERAATLLGAADSLWQETGSSVYQHLAGLHDEVRRALGGEIARPASLSYDEIIAYALQEKPPGRAGADEPSKSPLTRREREVAELVAQGLSNKEIAARLVIAQRTAEGHVANILVKLGFTSRAQIAAWVAAQPRAAS